MPDGRMAYTRDGSLELDAEGRLVTQDGFLVDPAVTIPAETKSVAISAAGLITGSSLAIPSDQLGQIQLAASSTRRASNRSATTFMSRRRPRARPSMAIRERKSSLDPAGLSRGSECHAVVEITSLIQAAARL